MSLGAFFSFGLGGATSGASENLTLEDPNLDVEEED